MNPRASPPTAPGLRAEDADVDPVPVGPDGTDVGTWREDYPHEERPPRAEHDRTRRLLQIELLELQDRVKETGQAMRRAAARAAQPPPRDQTASDGAVVETVLATLHRHASAILDLADDVRAALFPDDNPTPTTSVTTVI